MFSFWTLQHRGESRRARTVTVPGAALEVKAKLGSEDVFFFFFFFRNDVASTPSPTRGTPVRRTLPLLLSIIHHQKLVVTQAEEENKGECVTRVERASRSPLSHGRTPDR